MGTKKSKLEQKSKLELKSKLAHKSKLTQKSKLAQKLTRFFVSPRFFVSKIATFFGKRNFFFNFSTFVYALLYRNLLSTLRVRGSKT